MCADDDFFRLGIAEFGRDIAINMIVNRKSLLGNLGSGEFKLVFDLVCGFVLVGKINIMARRKIFGEPSDMSFESFGIY
jgi:hypothetical protein